MLILHSRMAHLSCLRSMHQCKFVNGQIAPSRSIEPHLRNKAREHLLRLSLSLPHSLKGSQLFQHQIMRSRRYLYKNVVKIMKVDYVAIELGNYKFRESNCVRGGRKRGT